MSRRIRAWLGVVLLLSCNEVTPDLSGSPAATELDEVILQRAALHEGGANVNVSNAAGVQSELGIAVNPTNALNLVATSNNVADISRLGLWFSNDGGTTWTANFLDETEDTFGANDSRFDPNVAYDADGNVYVIYSTTGTGNRLLVARSTDGGQNFNQVTTVTTDAGANNLHTGMITTRAGDGPDDVLVVYARVQAGGESIEAALSLDAGATFPTTNTNINDTLERTFLPWAVAEANGNFAVVWEVNQSAGTGAIFHDTLNGTTLADNATDTQVTTVQITDFDAATSKIPAQPDRGLFSVTTVDVDRTTGRLYLSYTDRANSSTNDTDVFVRTSDDNGANWSAPIQVNDDTGTTSQFMPRLSVDQTTGVVYAVWYDARNDATNNQRVDIFASSSTDRGATWTANHQLTTATSNESTTNAARDGNNYAEYIGLSANGGVAHAAWTDARDANFTAGTNEDVYTARLDNNPPVARCRNVTVNANASCQASASVDNGSSDPDGDPLTCTAAPPPPYGRGNTTVTLTCTDNRSESASCTGVVTVVDVTPPAIVVPPAVTITTCSGANIGVATGTDNCGPVTITNNAPAVFPLGPRWLPGPQPTAPGTPQPAFNSSRRSSVTAHPAVRPGRTSSRETSSTTTCMAPRGTTASSAWGAMISCSETAGTTSSQAARGTITTMVEPATIACSEDLG